jgi:hypothetical protein
LAAVGQGSVAAEPLSPLHAAQADVLALHTGVLPEQAAGSPAVHWTQVAEAGLHTGVGAAQLASVAQASHVPARGPVATHSIDTHARVATDTTQLPPGTGWPLGTLGWHAPGPARLLHQLPAPHSASVKQADPHAPDATLQNGLAAVGQGLVAVDPLSPLHAAHTFRAEHTGVGLAQSADVTQATQLPAAGPVVTHRPAPAVGQGCVAVDPKSPLHATQRLVVPSQMGCTPPGQSALNTHPPQWLAPSTAAVHGPPPKPVPLAGVAVPAAPAAAP